MATSTITYVYFEALWNNCIKNRNDFFTIYTVHRLFDGKYGNLFAKLLTNIPLMRYLTYIQHVCIGAIWHVEKQVS